MADRRWQSPYTHDEWQEIKARVGKERERRAKLNQPFGQNEQSAFVEAVVRGLRTKEASGG